MYLSSRLALKLFRGEPAISGFDWNFTAIHTSSQHFSTYMGSVLHEIYTRSSVCTWIGHPVSGLQHATSALFRLAFASAPMLQHLNLAPYRNSLARSTKSTRSLSLPLLVSTRFQVLFHSPPGVLFTFPSRYYSLSVTGSYLALGGGPPCFIPGFTCPVLLWCRARSRPLSPTGISPSLSIRSSMFARCLESLARSATPNP